MMIIKIEENYSIGLFRKEQDKKTWKIRSKNSHQNNKNKENKISRDCVINCTLRLKIEALKTKKNKLS